MRLQICLGTLFVLFVSVPIPTKALPPPAGSQSVTKNPPATCPVTLPDERSGAIDASKPVLILGPFGAWPEGTVVFRPGGAGQILPDGSLSMKFGWTRGKGLRGKLKIHGRRLDAPAPPLGSRIPDGYGDTGFQATALIFPTEGCWEVTGEVGETNLTFVTRVVKVGDPK